MQGGSNVRCELGDQVEQDGPGSGTLEVQEEA